MMSSPSLKLLLCILPVTFAATFDVSVGAAGNFKYDPQFVTAAPGDIVNFVFHPKNHTVTQSSFDQPCVPLAGGFDSGFKPVAAEGGGLPNWQYTVVDTNPVWVHCEQKGHCGQGMVFAVNPPAEPSPKSFAAFQALAISINGTASATTATAASTAYVTPPAPQWQTATATVTVANSVWTTTYSSYDGTPPPTPAAQPANHKISVGADGLTYTPSNISASIGDTVTFEFHPKNHTVTQSSFLNPCQALDQTSKTGQVGFKSGFLPVGADVTTFPTFQITINDTAPIWGYCGQPGHCAAGMVFSINAVESGPNNFAAFQDLAKHTGTVAAANSSVTATSPSATDKPASGALVGANVPYGIATVLAALGMVFASL
ncbi:hypothetical protein DXG01_001748 [Tephrocybe rancida]|nr:hypothetical protein DXG01_001748 [Tephrocybe rancida]